MSQHLLCFFRKIDPLASILSEMGLFFTTALWLVQVRLCTSSICLHQYCVILSKFFNSDFIWVNAMYGFHWNYFPKSKYDLNVVKIMMDNDKNWCKFYIPILNVGITVDAASKALRLPWSVGAACSGSVLPCLLALHGRSPPAPPPLPPPPPPPRRWWW